MPVTRYNALRKYGRTRFRRRRASVATRAKYQKPTANNQRKQILGNARMITRIKRLMPQPVYCDWQYKLQVLGEATPDGDPTFSQKAFTLVDFSNTWNPVLRISTTVNNEVATKIIRMNFNMRYSLVGSDWAQMTIFVVTLRKDAANRDPTVVPLQSGADFVANTDLFNVRLNSAIYKVHYSRNVTLSSSTFLGGAATVQNNTFAGNPNTTIKRGNFVIKPRLHIRAPAQDFWRNMVPNQLPYYQRLFLLTFITQNNNTQLAAGSQCKINMDMLCTTVNTA